MITDYVGKYIEYKLLENEEEIRITFYELRVKENLSEEQTEQFLQLCKNKLENMNYNVYFTGETFTYKQCNRMVQPNELLIAVKKGESNNEKDIKTKHRQNRYKYEYSKLIKKNGIITISDLCHKSKTDLKNLTLSLEEINKIQVELQLLGLNLKGGL